MVPARAYSKIWQHIYREGQVIHVNDKYVRI